MQLSITGNMTSNLGKEEGHRSQVTTTVRPMNSKLFNLHYIMSLPIVSLMDEQLPNTTSQSFRLRLEVACYLISSKVVEPRL